MPTMAGSASATRSMPFWSVRRLTTPSRNVAGLDVEPQARLQRGLVRGALRETAPVVARGQVHVGRRIPHGFVDAVQDARQHVRPLAQQPVEAHAAFGRADLRRVRRRHRRDAVGEREPRLQEADRAVVLDAVDGVRVRRQAQLREQLARELPLEREVVHGHHRARPRRAAVVEQRGDEPRLPVVRVHDVGREARDDAARDRTPRTRQVRRTGTRCRATACRRGRRTDCRAARRGAARRARAGRGPPRARRGGAPAPRAGSGIRGRTSRRAARRSRPGSPAPACASPRLRARAPAAARPPRLPARRS